MTESRQDRINRFEGYEQWATIAGIASGGLASLGFGLMIGSQVTDGVTGKNGEFMSPDEIFSFGANTFLISAVVACALFALSAKFKKISTDSLHYRAD